MDKPRGAPPHGSRDSGLHRAPPRSLASSLEGVPGHARFPTAAALLTGPLRGAHAMGTAGVAQGARILSRSGQGRVESSGVEGAGAGQLSGRLCGRPAPSQGFWLGRHPGAAHLSRPGLVTATSGLRCPASAIRMPVTLALSAGRTQVCCKRILPRRSPPRALERVPQLPAGHGQGPTRLPWAFSWLLPKVTGLQGWNLNLDPVPPHSLPCWGLLPCPV